MNARNIALPKRRSRSTPFHPNESASRALVYPGIFRDTSLTTHGNLNKHDVPTP